MPRPCSVCTHFQRAEIDQHLARQVVNVAQVARVYGLGKDAVARHRRDHLPAFLPSLTARQEAAPRDALLAEAKRLYDISLDALAAAEAGVLVEVGRDGEETRKVSSSAVARSLREARASLGLLVDLSIDGPPAERGDQPHPDQALAASLARTLERAEARAIGQHGDGIEEAVVVDPPTPSLDVDGHPDERPGRSLVESTIGTSHERAFAPSDPPPPGPGRTGPAGVCVVPSDSATPNPSTLSDMSDSTTEHDVIDVGEALEPTDPTPPGYEAPSPSPSREEVRAAAIATGVNPASSDAELRYMGWDV